MSPLSTSHTKRRLKTEFEKIHNGPDGKNELRNMMLEVSESRARREELGSSAAGVGLAGPDKEALDKEEEGVNQQLDLPLPSQPPPSAQPLQPPASAAASLDEEGAAAHAKPRQHRRRSMSLNQTRMNKMFAVHLQVSR